MGRVLIADDDERLARIVAAMLGKLGHQATVAHDGLDAAAQFEAAGVGTFELLITDLEMPRLDGFELVELARGEQPELPVVVMSGLVWTSIQSRSDVPPVFRQGEVRDGLVHLGDGPDQTVFLTKPFTFDQFSQAIGVVLA